MQYGMVIDLQSCVGCGACALACKLENNTPNRDDENGQTMNWADFVHRTSGTFPDVEYETLPVLCNHCSDAACVEVCPAEPKAIYKDENGITMISNERCIGCQSCQEACPYSAEDVNAEKADYSVISLNAEPPHGFFRDREEAIPKCTTSGAELAALAGDSPPHHTHYEGQPYASVRQGDIVEKCTFCAHRLERGQLPACVVACPSEARVFGDLGDSKSEPRQLLAQHKSFVLKPDAGTKPNVHYVRSFKAPARS